ncbi:hypothetical protein HZC08_00550 [Candidatus Micrarchaeota archaeon]|nr:hypothetical protein [Candidatus Micrarchaeota archaeon]
MIPNIYSGNYKLLAIPPLILIILSLILIPNVKLGVDFTGGTLISLSLAEKTDQQAIKTALEADGISGIVRVFDSALGQRAEIELVENKNLVKADQLKEQFNKLLNEVIQLEVDSNQGNTTLEYIEKKKQLNSIADEIFFLAENGKNANSITNLNTLQKDFSSSYGLVYSKKKKKIESAINKNIKYSSLSVQTVSPLLGSRFLEKAFWVVIFAGVLSVIFVFLFLKNFVPSLAVLSGAVADILIALGAMSLFQIPLTLASFAALLMLIGFSLDTDILLTMRMIKRVGEAREKAFDALKTGTTMSIAAIIAFGTLFIVSQITHIATYYEISAVALAGLVGDLFATWGVNAVLLIWHLEEGKKHATN